MDIGSPMENILLNVFSFLKTILNYFVLYRITLKRQLYTIAKLPVDVSTLSEQ